MKGTKTRHQVIWISRHFADVMPAPQSNIINIILYHNHRRTTVVHIDHGLNKSSQLKYVFNSKDYQNITVICQIISSSSNTSEICVRYRELRSKIRCKPPFGRSNKIVFSFRAQNYSFKFCMPKLECTL